MGYMGYIPLYMGMELPCNFLQLLLWDDPCGIQMATASTLNNTHSFQHEINMKYVDNMLKYIAYVEKL